MRLSSLEMEKKTGIKGSCFKNCRQICQVLDYQILQKWRKYYCFNERYSVIYNGRPSLVVAQ